MFWNKKNDNELFVRCDDSSARSAYRVDADESLSVSLIVENERVEIDNLSANGIAFRVARGGETMASSVIALRGVLSVGDCHNPIPVELEVVVRQDNLLRCKISHQDLLAQKQLAAAINRYQKLKIRAAEQLRKEQQNHVEI